MASAPFNLCEAKTQLSSLVERAAKGEKLIIARAGKPLARLSAIASSNSAGDPEELPFGQNLLGIAALSDDWGNDLPQEMVEDPEGDRPFLSGPIKEWQTDISSIRIFLSGSIPEILAPRGTFAACCAMRTNGT